MQAPDNIQIQKILKKKNKKQVEAGQLNMQGQNQNNVVQVECQPFRQEKYIQKRISQLSQQVEYLIQKVQYLLQRKEELNKNTASYKLQEQDLEEYNNRRQRKQAEILNKSCSGLLKQLQQHKWAWPFNEPVDVEKYPNYLEVIKRPMDLSTVRNKLDQGIYQNALEFIYEIELMFNNAQCFNPPGSDVFIMAETLKEKFLERLNQSVIPKLIDEEKQAKIDYFNLQKKVSQDSYLAQSKQIDEDLEQIAQFTNNNLLIQLRDLQSLAASICLPLSEQELQEVYDFLKQLDDFAQSDLICKVLRRNGNQIDENDAMMDSIQLRLLKYAQQQLKHHQNKFQNLKYGSKLNRSWSNDSFKTDITDKNQGEYNIQKQKSRRSKSSIGAIKSQKDLQRQQYILGKFRKLSIKRYSQDQQNNSDAQNFVDENTHCSNCQGKVDQQQQGVALCNECKTNLLKSSKEIFEKFHNPFAIPKNINKDDIHRLIQNSLALDLFRQNQQNGDQVQPQTPQRQQIQTLKSEQHQQIQQLQSQALSQQMSNQPDYLQDFLQLQQNLKIKIPPHDLQVNLQDSSKVQNSQMGNNQQQEDSQNPITQRKLTSEMLPPSTGILQSGKKSSTVKQLKSAQNKYKPNQDIQNSTTQPYNQQNYVKDPFAETTDDKSYLYYLVDHLQSMARQIKYQAQKQKSHSRKQSNSNLQPDNEQGQKKQEIQKQQQYLDKLGTPMIILGAGQKYEFDLEQNSQNLNQQNTQSVVVESQAASEKLHESEQQLQQQVDDIQRKSLNEPNSVEEQNKVIKIEKNISRESTKQHQQTQNAHIVGQIDQPNLQILLNPKVQQIKLYDQKAFEQGPLQLRIPTSNSNQVQQITQQTQQIKMPSNKKVAQTSTTEDQKKSFIKELQELAQKSERNKVNAILREQIQQRLQKEGNQYANLGIREGQISNLGFGKGNLNSDQIDKRPKQKSINKQQNQNWFNLDNLKYQNTNQNNLNQRQENNNDVIVQEQEQSNQQQNIQGINSVQNLQQRDFQLQQIQQIQQINDLRNNLQTNQQQGLDADTDLQEQLKQQQKQLLQSQYDQLVQGNTGNQIVMEDNLMEAETSLDRSRGKNKTVSQQQRKQRDPLKKEKSKKIKDLDSQIQKHDSYQPSPSLNQMIRRGSKQVSVHPPMVRAQDDQIFNSKIHDLNQDIETVNEQQRAQSKSENGLNQRYDLSRSDQHTNEQGHNSTGYVASQSIRGQQESVRGMSTISRENHASAQPNEEGQLLNLRDDLLTQPIKRSQSWQGQVQGLDGGRVAYMDDICNNGKIVQGIDSQIIQDNLDRGVLTGQNKNSKECVKNGVSSQLPFIIQKNQVHPKKIVKRNNTSIQGNNIQSPDINSFRNIQGEGHIQGTHHDLVQQGNSVLPNDVSHQIDNIDNYQGSTQIYKNAQTMDRALSLPTNQNHILMYSQTMPASNNTPEGQQGPLGSKRQLEGIQGEFQQSSKRQKQQDIQQQNDHKYNDQVELPDSKQKLWQKLQNKKQLQQQSQDGKLSAGDKSQEIHKSKDGQLDKQQANKSLSGNKQRQSNNVNYISSCEKQLQSERDFHNISSSEKQSEHRVSPIKQITVNELQPYKSGYQGTINGVKTNIVQQPSGIQVIQQNSKDLSNQRNEQRNQRSQLQQPIITWTRKSLDGQQLNARDQFKNNPNDNLNNPSVSRVLVFNNKSGTNAWSETFPGRPLTDFSPTLKNGMAKNGFIKQEKIISRSSSKDLVENNLIDTPPNLETNREESQNNNKNQAQYINVHPLPINHNIGDSNPKTSVSSRYQNATSHQSNSSQSYVNILKTQQLFGKEEIQQKILQEQINQNKNKSHKAQQDSNVQAPNEQSDLQVQQHSGRDLKKDESSLHQQPQNQLDNSNRRLTRSNVQDSLLNQKSVSKVHSQNQKNSGSNLFTSRNEISNSMTSGSIENIPVRKCKKIEYAGLNTAKLRRSKILFDGKDHLRKQKWVKVDVVYDNGGQENNSPRIIEMNLNQRQTRRRTYANNISIQNFKQQSQDQQTNEYYDVDIANAKAESSMNNN